MLNRNFIKRTMKKENGKEVEKFSLNYMSLINLSKKGGLILQRTSSNKGVSEFDEYFSKIRMFDIFQNKNQKLNLMLASSLIENNPNELVEFVPFLKEFALEKLVLYANMGNQNITRMINDVHTSIESNKNKNNIFREKREKFLQDKLEKLEYLRNNWGEMTEKVADYFETSDASFVVLNPILLVGLFENNLSYLFDYRTRPLNTPKIQKDAPEKLKEIIRNNLLKESRFIDYIKTTKTVINRELYLRNLENIEVFDLLKVYESVPAVYGSIISSKDFVRKEYDCLNDLIANIEEENILEKILINLEKIKKPKNNTVLLKKIVTDKLDDLKKSKNFEEDIFFDKSTIEEKFEIKLKLINNPFLNKDSALYFSYFIDSLRKEDLEYMGINKIYTDQNSRKGILNINIIVKKENLGEKYYKELIKKIFLLKSNWSDVFNFDKAQMIATLKEFHLMYIIEKNTSNTPKESVSKKKI